MMKFTLGLVPLALLIGLLGCGGGDDNAQTGTLNFGVSDAPVYEADRVVLAFNQAVLVPQNGDDPILIDLDEQNPALIDLLLFQGSSVETLISDHQLPVGEYRMCLYALDGDGTELLSFVDSPSQGVIPLRVNSKGSCHGVSGDTVAAGRLSFDKGNELVAINAGRNDFVAEFNLQQGLVDPVGQPGMFIKPNSVQLINQAGAGSLSGSVSESFYDDCETDMAGEPVGAATFAHSVYLFPGDTASEDMGDIPGDAGFGDGSTLVEPLAVTSVSMDEDGEGNPVYGYEFGFVAEGQYRVGYSCVADADEPDSHQVEGDGFAFYLDAGPVDVVPGEVAIQDLTPAG